MARLNAQQAASFPTTSGGTNFLSLQNDGDSAVVRFAYNNVNEIPIYLIHDAHDGERNRNLGCLRSDYSEPVSNCPLCQAEIATKKVFYFNVRNEETGEMQVWQRSEAYFNKNMKTLLERLSNGGSPLCSIPIEIVRNGVKGDTKTSYTFIPRQADSLTLDQFPEDIVVEEKGIVLDFEFDELQNYIETGIFPGKGNQVPSTGREVTRGPVNAPINNQPVRGATNNNRRTMMNNGGY